LSKPANTIFSHVIWPRVKAIQNHFFQTQMQHFANVAAANQQ
jgi:hypothetical protein